MTCKLPQHDFATAQPQAGVSGPCGMGQGLFEDLLPSLLPSLLPGLRTSVLAGVASLVTCLLPTLCQPAKAQVTPLPPPIEAGESTNRLPGIKLDDARGRQVPMDLRFTNDQGKVVRLSDLVGQNGKPTVLMLGYYQCPDLCNLTMNGMLDAFNTMHETGFELGQDYDVITVSIDPRETPQLAAGKKHRYATHAQSAEALNLGWHMLVSPESDDSAKDQSESVANLAKTLGFGYRYVKQTERYGHAAALYVLSPDGLVTRVLYGTSYDPVTMKYSLVEAADGKVGSPLDQILMTCFSWDHEKGKYTLFAFGLLKWAAGLFLCLVAGLIALMVLAEKNRKKRLQQVSDSQVSPPATSAT